MLFNFASDCRIGKKFEEKCLDRNSSDSSTCIPTYHRYRGSFVRKQCEDIVAENLMLLSQSEEYVLKKKKRKKSSFQKNDRRKMENSSVANYCWNFYGRFNAAYLRSAAKLRYHSAFLSGINEEKRRKRWEENKEETGKISLGSRGNLVSWYLHVISHRRFYGEGMGSRETKENAKVELSTFHFLFLRVLLNLSAFTQDR